MPGVIRMWKPVTLYKRMREMIRVCVPCFPQTYQPQDTLLGAAGRGLAGADRDCDWHLVVAEEGY